MVHLDGTQMVHITKRTFYDCINILHTLLSLSSLTFNQRGKKLLADENYWIQLLVLVVNLHFMNTLVL